MPRAHGVIAAMAGEGIVNLANQFAERKKEERERSRVKDLLSRLESASDAEKVSIYGQLDPKLALGFEIANEKNKVKREGQQIVSDAYQEAGLGQAPQTEAIEPPGLGGEQGKVVQPLNQGDATKTQTGFSPNAPNRAAQNATALRQNAPFSQDFMGQSFAQVPQGTAGSTQQQQQLTPRQRAQAIRARAGQVAAINPAAAQGLLQEAKAIEREAEHKENLNRDVYVSERDYATKLTDNFRQKQSNLRNTLPIKEQAFQLAEQALASGEVGAFSGANLARRTGMNEFESASGAGLNLAAKEFLIGNLSQVSAKAQNRWLEQIMSSAFPRVGQSNEANQTVLEGVRAAKDLANMELQIGSTLEQEDLNKLGYVDKDIEYRVQKAMEPESKKILDRLSYRTKVLSESEKSSKQLLAMTNKKVPQGTYLTRKMFNVFKRKLKTNEAAIERAKILGYKIPTNKDVKDWIDE
jgi:hypothetical protein